MDYFHALATVLKVQEIIEYKEMKRIEIVRCIVNTRYLPVVKFSRNVDFALLKSYLAGIKFRQIIDRYNCKLMWL